MQTEGADSEFVLGAIGRRERGIMFCTRRPRGSGTACHRNVELGEEMRAAGLDQYAEALPWTAA